MFGIFELRDRMAAIEVTIKSQAHVDRTALSSTVKDVQTLQTRVATVEAQTDKIAVRVADEARRGDEMRTQIMRISKTLSEVVERQSAHERTIGIHSEHMLELDKRIAALEANAAPPIPAFPTLRHKPAAVGSVHITEDMEKHRRVRHRKTWPERYKDWLLKAAKSDVEIAQKALMSYDPEGVQFNHSLVKAAFAVGLCDWLRQNYLAELPSAKRYEQTSGNKRFKVTIPDLQNPKHEPVNFGLESKGEQLRALRQWTRLARFVKESMASHRGTP